MLLLKELCLKLVKRFYTDGQYFTLKNNEEKGEVIYYLEAEAAGSVGNRDL